MSLALSPEAQDLLFREARTANTFTDEPVTDEQIEEIYDLVKQGPTAMNTTPLRIVAVRTAEGKARVVEHMAEGNKAKTASAPLVAIVAADVDFHDEMHRLFPHFPGARDMFAADEDSRTEMAVRNSFLQLGYFVIGVRAAGLAAGPMAGLDADAMEKEFFGDGRHKVLAVVNIGHPGPDASHPRGPRLPFEDVVTYA